MGGSIDAQLLGIMATEYSRTASQVAVAQIAEAAGFDTMQQSALDVLSDLMLRYVGEIGATSHGYAELSNRTTPSADDLVMALKDVGVKVEDIAAYTNAKEEVPFAHTMPPYPVQRRPKWPPTFSQRKEEPPPHVPDWLPALPDRHTYMATPAFTGHDTDAKRQRLAASKAKRQAEKALVRLSERMGDAPASVASDGGASAVSNPFLVTPSWEAASVAEAADRIDGGAAPSTSEPDAADAEQHGSLTEAFAAAASGNKARTQQPLGTWSDAATDGGRPPGSLQGAVPTFQLDWLGVTRRPPTAATFREEDDAFAAAEQEGADAAAAARAKALGPAGRKERAKARNARGGQDAGAERAKEILAAGVDAPLTMGEDYEPRGRGDRESL